MDRVYIILVQARPWRGKDEGHVLMQQFGASIASFEGIQVQFWHRTDTEAHFGRQRVYEVRMLDVE